MPCPIPLTQGIEPDHDSPPATENEVNILKMHLLACLAILTLAPADIVYMPDGKTYGAEIARPGTNNAVTIIEENDGKKLTKHPRILAGEDDFRCLQTPPEMPVMVQARKDLITNARKYVHSSKLTGRASGQDPSGLGIARGMIDRVITLVTAFRMTGEKCFRSAAIKYIVALDAEKTGRLLPQNQLRGFWLTDGEECAGIAIAYDWMYDSLSAAERKTVVDIARNRLLALGLEECRMGGQWWFAKRFSNWNAVCAGGLGMLCLAMYEDCPAAREILPHIEESLSEFITPLKDTDGGWPEGVGYWNYGMAYAFGYLLSWERSMGKAHPLMKLPATKKTLSFPLDFSPNAMSAGFGDNNHFHPSPFHYAAAKRFKLDLVMGAIDSYMTETGRGLGGLMGGSATGCVLHPGTVSKDPRGQTRVAKVWKGLGWGLIADSMPRPKLYLSMRGGNTIEEHTHVDLLSFRVLVGKEWLIENGRSGRYLFPTTFSEHRAKNNDLNATYKNTIFVNGVGPIPGSETNCEQVVRGQGCYGVRMEASSTLALPEDASIFCGRLALMVNDSAFVIIDRVKTPGLSLVESRMHSYKDVTFSKTGAMIKGDTESMRVTYASLEPAGLFRATTAPASPTNPSATMMRWSPIKLYKEAVLVTLLTPGSSQTAATVVRDGKNFLITLTIKGKTVKLRIRPDLTLLQ